MATLKYVLNKSRQYTNGEFLIYLRINYKGSRRLVSMKKTTSLVFWDYKNGKVVIDSGLSKERKRYLEILKSYLEEKFATYKRELINLELRKPFYTIDDIVDLIETHQSSTSLFKFTENLIARLEKSGKVGNSKAYKNTLSVFKGFRNNRDLSFDELSYKVIKNFEEDLQSRDRSVNAISFHMRTLRSVYNKAIKEGVAHLESYPFKDYQIKREKTSKRAIVKDNIASIKELDLSNNPDLDKARDYFLFSFYTRGMSFVDMAHLKVSNISEDRIYYSRNKTNQKFSIKLIPQITTIISKYNNLQNRESYLFPIIIDPAGDIYTQYRNALRLTNKKLNKIGKMVGLSVPLTTYVSRHSWATIAKREGIPTAIISEGLGHETERTTQIYLDSFENDVLDNANELISKI